MPNMSKPFSGSGVVAILSESRNSERSQRVSDDFSVLSNRSGGSRYSQYRGSHRNRGNGGSARDIVQEIYDKMGVNYIRGQPTNLETLLTQNNGGGETRKSSSEPQAAATRSILRSHAYGNANDSSKTPPIPRPSRGRLSQQWPPPGPIEEPESASVVVSVSGMKSRFDRKSLLTSSPVGSATNHQVERRDIDEARAVFNQPDDERDTTSVVSSSKSVKERISMYRASTSTGQRPQLYGSNVKKHPSKINLYDSSADAPNTTTDGATGIDKGSFIRAMKDEHPSNNSVSRHSVGDVWLSALHRSTAPSSANTVSGGTVAKKIPVVEFPHGGDMDGDDGGSAASSVSGEDFISAFSKRRGRSITGRSTSGYVEKLVEERVQAQVAALERKMNAEIRRIEKRIEQECKVSIAALQRRNQELTNLLEQNGIMAM